MRIFCVIMRDNKFLHLISPIKYIYQLILSNHLLQSVFETLLTFWYSELVVFPFFLQIIRLSLILKLSLFFLYHYILNKLKRIHQKTLLLWRAKLCPILRIVWRNRIATLFCSLFSTTYYTKKEMNWNGVGGLIKAIFKKHNMTSITK